MADAWLDLQRAMSVRDDLRTILACEAWLTAHAGRKSEAERLVQVQAIYHSVFARWIAGVPDVAAPVAAARISRFRVLAAGAR